MGKAFITVAWLLFLAMLTWGFSRWLAEQNNPNQEVQSTRVNGTPSVVLKRNRQGHYVANGKINGQAVTFLVDTGATDVAVPLNWAKRLNLSAKGRAVSIQTANGVITAYRVTLDRELLRKYYLERGFADFRVLSAVAELTHDRSDFFITFTVDEGALYKFGEIEISSSLRNLDTEVLRKNLTMSGGQIYNAEAIEETIEKLNFAVGRLGYAFVDIRPRVNRSRDEKLINLVFQINEGPRVYIERINITGNIRTLDKVIRREMKLAEGDAFNTAKLRRSRQQIRRLGFFDKVDVAQQEGETPDKVVIDVDVQEQSTGELSFGVGISTTENVVGDVSIRERNLLGKGQDLKLSLGLSTSKQEIDLSFTEPYFLDRNVSAGFDIFSRKEDQQDRSSFDEQSQGFSVRFRFPITENLRQGLRYTLRDDTIEDIAADTSPFILVDEGSSVTSSVGYDLVYDTRDDIFLPTKGVVISGSQELAGLGGDIQFIRSTAKWSYFYAFNRDVVGKLALSGGHIIGLDQDVRVTNRYFLGGDSLRGFEGGGVGPRPKPLILKGLGSSYVWLSEYSLPCSCAAVWAGGEVCVSSCMLPISSSIYYYTKNPCSQV